MKNVALKTILEPRSIDIKTILMIWMFPNRIQSIEDIDDVGNHYKSCLPNDFPPKVSLHGS